MTYARLSAAYGLSYLDINAMPLSAINAYIAAIPAVQAERRLIAADGASIPWMKNPGQTLKNWQETAYGKRATRRKAPLGLLMLLGIGVERVKADG